MNKNIINFINLIKNNYNKKQIINDLKITNDIFNYKKSDFNLENLYNTNSYINKPFKELNKVIKITFIQNKKNININIYYDDKTKNIKSIIINIIKRINVMISLFSNIISETNIIFDILLYYAPRIIYKNMLMSEINNKSYFNCTCGYYNKINNNNSKIFISRLNGCLSLLTHELCHLCKLDFGGYDTFNEWKEYFKTFSNSKAGYFTEGINNAISSIIHAIFLSCENKNKSFEKYYLEEYNYSYIQCQKLIKYFNYNSLEELMNAKTYEQYGQLFEYIILRYIYLKYINNLFHLDKNINKKQYFDLFIKLLNNEKNKIVNYKDNKKIESMEYYFNI